MIFFLLLCFQSDESDEDDEGSDEEGGAGKLYKPPKMASMQYGEITMSSCG